MTATVRKMTVAALLAATILTLTGCFGLEFRVFEISDTELVLKQGETAILAVSGPSGEVSWLAEDERVATVDDGAVTGVGVGSTLVLAVCGGDVAECVVTVTEDNGTDDLELIKSGYKLIWHDEFDGESLDAGNWSYQTGTRDNYHGSLGTNNWGNDEMQYYREDNVKLDDGKLVITAQKESEKVGGKSYTSGRITSRDKFTFTYGYIEAKIKAPVGDGMWPAFWMLPQASEPDSSHNEYGGWARNGEIDIMEIKGRLPEQYGTALHFGGNYPQNDSKGKTVSLKTPADYWHVYALEWTADSITWLCDGAEVFKLDNTQWWTAAVSSDQNPTAPFDKPFYILFNVAVGGKYDGYVKPTDDFTSASMSVDYVRVYQPISK